jgi:glycosyltransferase involved in cell wall biosynthesis
MTRVLLVPDLPLERWPSMDRYASRLAMHLRRHAGDLEVAVAGEIAGLTIEPGSETPGLRISNPWRIPELPGLGTGELTRYLARYWSYPRRVRHLRGDVLHVLDHSYAHLLMSRTAHPAVVTVHDLMPLITVRRGGNSLRDRLRNWLLGRVLHGLRRADAWIVATEWLREELARWLGSDRGIHVIPFGVDDAFFEPPPEKRETFRRRLRVPEGAFVALHVGSVGPRKNLRAVFEGIAALRRVGIDAWLLQVGGIFSQAQTRELEQPAIGRSVVTLGEAPEGVLRSAYAASDVLFFPSHYEGFGFPVLEAMASGLPVVTSGAGGLAEVAGDAAVVVGGRETAPYVTALRRVAERSQWREQLVRRGRQRAAEFRWVTTAGRTAEVYRELAAAGES